jgi:hypothetical protein
MNDLLKIQLKEFFGGNFSILGSKIGGNSIVYHIDFNSIHYAIKQFDGFSERGKSAFERENRAFTFLQEQKLPNIPKYFYGNRSSNFIVMEYIDGGRPNSDLNTMNAILGQVLELDIMFRKNDKFSYAIDAEISEKSLLQQVSERLKEIVITNEIVDYFTRIQELVVRLDNRKRVYRDFKFTYSFSDLGTHNLIFSAQGYTFIDFEFFGKDNVYKVICDFLLHPQNNFGIELNLLFLRQCMDIFELKEEAIHESLPNTALKWSVISLKRLLQLKANGTSSDGIVKQERLVEYFLMLSGSQEISRELKQVLSKDYLD